MNGYFWHKNKCLPTSPHTHSLIVWKYSVCKLFDDSIENDLVTTICKSAYDNKQACKVLKASHLIVGGIRMELFTEYRLISQTFTSSRICWKVFLIFPVQKTAASLEGLSSTQSCKAWPIVDPNNGASLGPWA
jgi:hypothetical protein